MDMADVLGHQTTSLMSQENEIKHVPLLRDLKIKSKQDFLTCKAKSQRECCKLCVCVRVCVSVCLCVCVCVPKVPRERARETEPR